LKGEIIMDKNKPDFYKQPIAPGRAIIETDLAFNLDAWKNESLEIWHERLFNCVEEMKSYLTAVNYFLDSAEPLKGKLVDTGQIEENLVKLLEMISDLQSASFNVFRFRSLQIEADKKAKEILTNAENPM